MELYEVLGITTRKFASAERIRSAYRAQAKIYHPDAGGDREKFERIQLAYEVLSDPERRRVYDETGRYDDKSADNKRAGAIQRIMQEIENATNQFIAAVPAAEVRSIVVGRLSSKDRTRLAEARMDPRHAHLNALLND